MTEVMFSPEDIVWGAIMIVALAVVISTLFQNR